MGKISKSRGGGPMSPGEMIERYSADAVRYWAASAGVGKDAIISEEKIQMGARLATKLWNVARFSERFLDGYTPPAAGEPLPALTPADRWILARLQTLIRSATQDFQQSDYTAAKNAAEDFFWQELADNYLEMAKQRLYDAASPQHAGARYTLYQLVSNTLKLFAPFLPYVCEAIYLGLFAGSDQPQASIHTSDWPAPEPALEDPQAEALGAMLVGVATAVRRYKSERSLPLGSELALLQIALPDGNGQTPAARGRLRADLEAASPDLLGITRARSLALVSELDATLEPLTTDLPFNLAIQR
jgi:valyl-tRNA synthetase